MGQNFSVRWNVYKHSGGNKGIVQRHYDMLDAGFPERVKSLKEWMRKEVLKQLNDQLAERDNKE